jgi:hypothetical protein
LQIKTARQSKILPANYKSSSDKLEEKYFDYNGVTPGCPDNPKKIF